MQDEQGVQDEPLTRAERRAAGEQSSRRSRRSRADRPSSPERVEQSLEEPLGAVATVSPPAPQSEDSTEPPVNRGTRRAASRRGRRRRVLTVLVAVVLAVVGGVAVVWSGVLPDRLQAVGSGLPESSAATTPVDPAADAPAPASADERLLSTVDQCWALARGELDPASASYGALVASAGGSDLQAWCSDLTGAPAHTVAAS